MEQFDFSLMQGMTSASAMVAPAGDTERRDREESFRAKVAMQQFMNHNGPIFRAFAYKGIQVRDVADGDALLSPTEAAATLTRLVVSSILKTKGTELSARDLSFFRTEAASWVAERWLRDEDYDIEAAAASIARAVESAGGDWDHDPFRDDRISNDVSVKMSAAGVTSRLMNQVAVYDFRLGRNEVLKTLLDTVISTSVQVANDMLPKSASRNDVANLVQTVSRNFASIMEAVYERKAAEVVGLLNGQPTEHKKAWLDRNRPLDTIVAEFREWALCFVGFAVATSGHIASPQPEAAEPGQRRA